MDGNAANPVVVALLFILRCLVPLLIMLGISYVLKRLGLIQETPPAPEEKLTGPNKPSNGGDLAHG